MIRSHGEVRCYYPDAKIVRIEPRTFRNVFPSLSPEQQQALTQFYEFRKAEVARVAGLESQAYVLEPRDGLRYGHKFWADRETGLLLKARLVNEKGDVVEQFAFSDITIGAKIDRDTVKPTWGPTPPDWQVRQGSAGDAVPHETGWVVTKLAARLPQDDGGVPHAARRARVGRASRILRRPGRGQRVRRAAERSARSTSRA